MARKKGGKMSLNKIDDLIILCSCRQTAAMQLAKKRKAGI